jgi:hypothetical protein
MNVMSDGSKIPATQLLGDRSMMGVPCIGATEYSSGVVGSSRSRYPFVRVKQKSGPSSAIRFEKTRIKLVRGQIVFIRKSLQIYRSTATVPWHLTPNSRPEPSFFRKAYGRNLTAQR